MGHVWVERSPVGWKLLPLPLSPVPLSELLGPGAGDGTIERAGPASGGAWVALGPASCGVAVNGRPLSALGLRVLHDRDELRCGPRRAYFTTERRPRVEAFSAAAPGAVAPPVGASPADPAARPVAVRAPACARCRAPLEAGAPAVSCPQCRAWHHEDARLGCWTYAATCALCDQPTPLDAPPRFTPEGL